MKDVSNLRLTRADWSLVEPTQGFGTDQSPMFNARVSTRLPRLANGRDVAFYCFADDGEVYVCKDDAPGRPVRATEWIGTSLARHLGIPVAHCCVIEDEDGRSFFGSRSPKRHLASRFQLEDHIRRSAKDETGRPLPWLGQFFAQLFAYDLFVCNPDRDLQNLILDQDGAVGVIKAIDFASASLIPFPHRKLLIESNPTTRVGAYLREQHGVHKAAAFEMLDRIGAVPHGAIAGILGQMPSDWLSDDQAGGFLEVWSNGKSQERVDELKALIEHEW